MSSTSTKIICLKTVKPNLYKYFIGTLYNIGDNLRIYHLSNE